MRLITAATAVAAALYMVFVVFYSAKVMFAAVASPYSPSQRLIKSTGIRSANAQRSFGAASIPDGAASSAKVTPVPVVEIPKSKPDAASIASWCARMQREGDAIARSFNGNPGKDECWGEKGSRTFLSRFISLQNKIAVPDSVPRVIIDVGCNKGDYIAELSPLLDGVHHAGTSTGTPAFTVHAFEAMPQNCKFIEQTPHVVKFSKQVRLHCVALGDADGTVEFESSGIIGDEGAKMHSSNAVSASTAGNVKVVSVPLRKLDSFATEMQADGRIVLLKVDAEGAEGRIFSGSQLLLQSVDLVLFEVGEPWYRTPSIWNVRDAAVFWAQNEFLAFRLGVDKLFRFDGAFYRSTHDADGNVYWGNAIAIRRNSAVLPHLLALYSNIPRDALEPGSDWSTLSSLQDACPLAAVPDPCIWHPNVPEDSSSCKKTGWTAFE